MMKHLRYFLFKRTWNIPQHAKTFHKLYAEVNGFALSKIARAGNDAMEYVYGEILFEPFIALLSLTHPDENTVFYDLGSGIGKAAVACALVYPVKQSVGIERFPNLYQQSIKQKEALLSASEYQHAANCLNFECNDFMQSSLDNATHIFIHATGFFGDHWLAICQKLAGLPKIKHIITISKPLKNSAFELSRTTQVALSWGIAQAFIHRPVYLQKETAG